ncbi:hypothetical protein R8N28_21235 [Vibrio sp. Vb1554]|uniref:hypothetical protein n=1 Tax=Vibrio TaxID=662 RepID=UPI0013B052F9|nr:MULTISPECIES: hypothetical protein [Vibrio]MDW3048259.1 hypothetical protein [Vibrio sp. Vb1554]
MAGKVKQRKARKVFTTEGADEFVKAVNSSARVTKAVLKQPSCNSDISTKSFHEQR